MTNYIHDLQTALREAAAREYPGTQPATPGASTQGRRPRMARPRRRNLAVEFRDAHRRHRRAVRLAAVGVAVAAVAFVVANLASTGSRSVVAPAQAQIISGTSAPPYASRPTRSMRRRR